MANRRILAYIIKICLKKKMVEQIEEVVGKEIGVRIQSQTKTSFFWKNKDLDKISLSSPDLGGEDKLRLV